MVVNAYVRGNAGDAALLSVCLRHVREAFPGAAVSVAGMEDPEAHDSFEGAPNLGSIRRYVADGGVSRTRRILRRVLLGPLALAVLLLPRPLAGPALRLLPREAAREARAVFDADLVVSTGGGYLQAGPGLDGHQNVFFVLLPVLLAQRGGARTVFAPQSFGPFPAAAQRRLVRRVLGRSALVLAREDVSLRHLADCGLTGAPVRRAVDSGFGFAPAPAVRWRERLGVAPGELLIGVTARRWLAPAAQDRYERELAAALDRHQDTGARVVLIPQVTTDYLGDDDRIVERRIAAHCRTEPLLVDERVDYRVLKGLYEECSLMVGTRFHSVVFALTSGVPCVAIEYEHKTRGIMADLGLGAWVVPIEEVDRDALAALIGELRERAEEYRELLAARMPGYVGDAERFPDLLRQAARSGAPVPVPA
ncbi:polysaccharide pyruvyl transferase family protein [Kitasatospora phosalacinea]|uniref:polysaccharide pyruvyl transferase family protein n=1 Tax=Kitasatospora phosalacinea TaxID=2065 RepID=UPI003647D3E0